MKRVIRFYIPKGRSGKEIKTVATANNAPIRKVGKHDVIVFNNDCGVQPILEKIALVSLNIESRLKSKLLLAGIDITKK